MKIKGTQRFSSLMYIAYLTITSIAFGSLFATPQFLFAQGEANETFFEAAVREAGQTEQQNQTAAAPPSSTEQQNQTEAATPSSTEQQNQTAAAPPSSTEQQNQTQSQNPFEQLGQAISKLFGGN
jgi:cytoskeletal protein RodZ